MCPRSHLRAEPEQKSGCHKPLPADTRYQGPVRGVCAPAGLVRAASATTSAACRAATAAGDMQTAVLSPQPALGVRRGTGAIPCSAFPGSAGSLSQHTQPEAAEFGPGWGSTQWDVATGWPWW